MMDNKNAMTKNDDQHEKTSSSPKDSSSKANSWQRFRSKTKEKQSPPAMTFRNLFQHATPLDIFYMVVATIVSSILGITLPLVFIVFGNTVDSFTDRSFSLCSLNFTSLSQQYCPDGIELTSINFYASMSLCNFTGSNFTNSSSNLNDQTNRQVMLTIITGIVRLICTYIRTILFNITAQRQTQAIKRKLFRSILTKDIAYFDQHKAGELSTLFTDDTEKVRDGIGEKFDAIVYAMSALIGGIVIALIKGWKLTLIILSISPLVFVIFTVASNLTTKLAASELKVYGKAGGIAEEVISSIRTVLSYNGQEREIQRYEQHLNDAKKLSIKKNIINGFTLGVQMLFMWGSCALGFWYGAKMVREGESSVGSIYIVFMNVIVSVDSLQNIGPYFQAFFQAKAAAYNIQQVINDSTDEINRDSKTAAEKDDLIGDIQFSHVRFSYPSRSDVSVLNDLSFDVKRGQTIALVGCSGSGKSTCVQLLQRFYNPHSGEILIDGKRINEYNLKWLRQHIGVVSQEPVLFHATIRENILFGCVTATDEQIHDAAKMANAHDFIMTLPDKYETGVGERGGALSGGQKQRVAIARALIRNPKILLLDEATSALDNESETIVQDALDRAAQGRTTLVIAHRLSTIRNADKIIVMNKGEVVEEGNHDSLMEARGTYYGLVEQQTLRQVEEDEQLNFEQQEATNILLSEQQYADRLSVRKDRSSTLISLTPSILTKLYGNKNSEVDEDLNADENIKRKKEHKSSQTLAILRMNKPEWLFIVIGCVAAMIVGGSESLFAVFETQIITGFQECDQDAQKRHVTLYVLVIAGLGILNLIFQLLQASMFAYSGGNLTRRLRSKSFHAILRQDIAYFDEAKHSTGALCTRLATETSAVQGASGVRFGFLFQNLVKMSAGIIIGFFYSWQLTLLIFAFFPMMLFGTYVQIRVTTRFENKDAILVEDAAKIIMETIQSIRTVVQLTKEDHFYDQYSRLLDILYRSSLKRIHISAFICSVSVSALNFALAAIISLGTTLIEQNVITFKDWFMTFDCVAITAQIAGQTLVLAPDYGKAMQAAGKIFELLKRKPPINNESKDGDEIPDFTGQLEFHGVYFLYPSRPESIILRKFNLMIKPGQKVALVGTSGSGKSTTIQLIERFYDANVGQLLADSKDIRSLNLQWYRSQIGIVSQEPILFDVSIRENISYGDNSRKDIPLEEIIEAAKNANIDDFIQLLPDAYETICGAKGIQLSGGQKQRIAIARALIRNPQILLLDEATSALDSESEKVVQEALDRAQQNRTSITIAHRLSTIQNSDLICVMHNGIIVEHGTHEELLARGDRYYLLAQGKLK